MKKFKNLLAKLSVAMMILCNTYIIPAYAKGTTGTPADSTAVTAPIDNLGELMVNIVASLGVITLVKSGYDYSQAFQNTDNTGMAMASKGIAGSLICIGLRVVLAVMGV